MAQRLAGQAVIMTGGGRGFGENMALAVAAEGADVIVADRDVDEAERVSTDISAAGGNALALGTDVSVEAEVEAMVNAAIERFGKVDVLVNNAGYACPSRNCPTYRSRPGRICSRSMSGAASCAIAPCSPG